jgi:predicted CXXCH cytochrome family protein
MKIKNLLIGLFLVVCGQVAIAQIANSAHDFTNASWNASSGGEICKVCHIPHGGVLAEGAPLWSRQMPTGPYTVYSSPTLNSTTVGQPSGSSKLCLSCHDNSIALGGTTFISSVGNPVGYANVGTDLSNDHPISFNYDPALVSLDPGLKPITSPSGIGSGTIESTMLFNGKMECASCHDVHNSANIAHLLVKSNVGSELCLTCHIK